MLNLQSFLMWALLTCGFWVFAEEIYYTDIGQTRIYLHHMAERDILVRNLVQSINHNNLLLTTTKLRNSHVRKIIPIATKYSEEVRDILDDSQLTKDSKGRPVYPDPVGHALLDEFAIQAQFLTENQFGIKIEGLSRDLSLNVSQDGIQISRDQFQRQIDYFQQLHHSTGDYLLCKEILLTDWQMAPGTFSAYLIQDEVSQDRFLMISFPGETLNLFYTEPFIIPDILSPFQTVLAPIDFSALSSSGSWKGKSIHTTIKGIVKENEMQDIAKKAIPLPLNIPKIEKSKFDLACYFYPNGITSYELFHPPSLPTIKKFKKHPDSQSMTILESSAAEHISVISELREAIDIKGNLQRVFHLHKKDEGFSQLGPLFSDLPPETEIIVINRSTLPNGYRPYILAEDFTSQQLPWIQMYLLPPERVMKISGENLKKLSLTPIEEILYRNHPNEDSEDCHNGFVGTLNHKLDILIFSSCL